MSTSSTQETASPITDHKSEQLCVRTPPGRYYVLRVILPSGRTMAVIVPYDTTPQDAAEAHKQLTEIASIVDKWR